MKKSLIFIGIFLFSVPPLFAQYGEAPVKKDQATTSGDETSSVSDQPAAETAPAARPARRAVKKSKPGDEAGIQQLFEQYSQAWAAADAQKLAGLFTADDSSFIGLMGQDAHGRKEVENIFTDGFSGALSGTQKTFSDFTVRFYPLPSVALVDCTATVMGMKNADGSTADPLKTHVFSMAVNRTGKKWQILLERSFAFYKPQVAAPAPVPTPTVPPSTPISDSFGLPTLDLDSTAALTATSGLPLPSANAPVTNKAKTDNKK